MLFLRVFQEDSPRISLGIFQSPVASPFRKSVLTSDMNSLAQGLFLLLFLQSSMKDMKNVRHLFLDFFTVVENLRGKQRFLPIKVIRMHFKLANISPLSSLSLAPSCISSLLSQKQLSPTPTWAWRSCSILGRGLRLPRC